MSTVGERIFELRNAKGKKMSRELLGEKIGVSKTAIKNWEDGENSPKVEFLEELAKYFNVSFHWLATGEGSMEPTILDKIRALDNVRVDYGDDDMGGIRIPIYDVYFCCGDGDCEEFAFEDIKGDRIFPPHFFTDKGVKPENFKLVCAKNDSQKPYINEHDMVGIDISDREIKDGEMYAILLDGERMFKRIFREPGNVLRLHCYNPDYPDKIVTAENHSSLVIVGREMYRAG